MKWMRGFATRGSMFAAALLLAACAGMGGGDGSIQVALSGDQEVPPVKTSGSGTATVSVASDRTVTARVQTKGIAGVAAHIHEGAPGANGPVIVPLEKSGESDWVSKPGHKLTESQYEAFKAGRTYFNVHTTQNKGGEIRGQIRPGGGSSGY